MNPFERIIESLFSTGTQKETFHLSPRDTQATHEEGGKLFLKGVLYRENRLVDPVGPGEGGTDWQQHWNTHYLVWNRAAGKLLHNTGSSAQGSWQPLGFSGREDPGLEQHFGGGWNWSCLKKITHHNYVTSCIVSCTCWSRKQRQKQKWIQYGKTCWSKGGKANDTQGQYILFVSSLVQRNEVNSGLHSPTCL